MENALRTGVTGPRLLLLSLLYREDWYIAATATPVSLLEEHEQSIAQCRIAMDGTKTSSSVDLNACDAPDRSDSHIEASRGSHEGFYGFGTAITRGDNCD